MGRFDGLEKSGGGSHIKGWIVIWILYLFMFLVILPGIMGCTDVSCTTQDPKNLLVLWLDVLTLFGAVTYLQFFFGTYAFLIVIGMWESFD